jgi:hypothetical protein
MSNRKVEREQLSAQFINQSFVRKLEQGRVKEAQDEGSRFIRSKMREESFAREILEPVEIGADEIDRDENTDQPKKIVEKEPDSAATFVTFKGSGQRTWFRGPRYSVYFGKVESEHFQKSKFELLTYQNDIRKILTDNSVKDMAAQEDKHFLAAIDASIALANGGAAVDAAAVNAAGAGTWAASDLLAGQSLNANSNPLSKSMIASLFQSMTMKKLPIGKLLMTKSTFLEALKFDMTDVGSDILKRHYDDGLDGQEKLFGVPVVTTIKNEIVNDNEIYLMAPENYLGNFFLLQDATLFIKQEADMIEFWSYSAPGIGIGNSKGAIKLSGFTSVA